MGAPVGHWAHALEAGQKKSLNAPHVDFRAVLSISEAGDCCFAH